MPDEPKTTNTGNMSPGTNTGSMSSNTQPKQSDRPTAPAGAAVEEARSAVGELTDQAKDMAPQAKEAAKETAMNVAETSRESAAGALDRVASGLKDQAGSGGVTGVAAEKTAEGMEAAAGYLKEHDTSEIWGDVETYVKAHPMQAVAAAVVTGIVVGRVLR